MGQFAAAIQLQWPQEKEMTVLTDHMTFGTFMAPFHRVGENPTLALERDVELIEWLDALGFDEAWIGEHHSGAGRLSPLRKCLLPPLQVAPAIFACTGVVSLPYHHPYMVANLHGALGPPDPGTRHAGRGPRGSGLRRVYVLY